MTAAWVAREAQIHQQCWTLVPCVLPCHSPGELAMPTAQVCLHARHLALHPLVKLVQRHRVLRAHKDGHRKQDRLWAQQLTALQAAAAEQ